VNDEVIKFGLSVTGMAHPRDITALEGARPGDDLVLTKALGTGLVTTALKRGAAAEEDVRATIDSMGSLNAAASRAMVRVGVHAATDITGFGLLGHLFEMLAAAGAAAELDTGAIPLLPGAERYAEDGVNTGGGRNNETYLGGRARFQAGVPEGRRVACFDPQTSGGLLMSTAPEKTPRLLEELEREGVPIRAVIGKVVAGEAGTIFLRAG
jgi:selenide,water dikinase